jgi:hypothetical protein
MVGNLICQKIQLLNNLKRNKMKQTAVEWLVEDLTRLGHNFKLYKKEIEQAKEMEKQQQEQDRNVYLNAYVDSSRAQAKLMYNEEDLECAWSSSEQNMRFQFSSSAYKGITFKQWLEKFKEEHREKE